LPPRTNGLFRPQIAHLPADLVGVKVAALELKTLRLLFFVNSIDILEYYGIILEEFSVNKGEIMDCECAICKNNKPFELPKEILEAVSSNNLVLFCGAGISTEGKNVLPYSFYTSIKEELGITDDTISFSQLMQQYCNKPNGRRKLLKNIRDRFKYIHSFPELERQATAFHRELSEIYPIQTIITTNWDTYFEDYCAAIPVTIPEDYALIDDNSRCVLKIHGSIQNLSSIIATSDDYSRRFKELQNGIIGATLKTILAKKTVVFVGFSFGDEDFTQIFSYLRNEMGDIYPHVYFVTLDETMKERLNFKNSTYIVTSGTFFLHKLKLALIDEGIIKKCSIYPIINTVLAEIEELHKKVANINLIEYPCAIYTLSYQDGVIHAFERFFQNYQTGEYNQPGRLGRIAGQYEEWIVKYHEAGNYWDEAYCEGYLNGLVLIEECERDNSIINTFPFLYLPSAKQPLITYAVFNEELARVSHGKSKYLRFAKTIINKKVGAGFVVQHPPY